jgi:hypothetical protein
LHRSFEKEGAAGWILMLGALFVAAVFILWLERGLTFIWDEFLWMENAGLRDVGFYFHPYGGHLIAAPYFIYKAILETFGVRYTAFSIVQVIGLSAGAVLVYVYAKRRLGPILALAPAIALLFVGASWEVLLQPMVGIQFLSATVPGLAAILMVERNNRRGDIGACALLCLAISGFDQSLAFVAGAIVSVALNPGWRGRIWVVAVPLVVCGAWHAWALQFEATPIHLSNIPLLPTYFVDSLAAFSNALVGLVPLVAPGPWSLLRLERSDINVISEAAVFTILEVLAISAAIWLMRLRGGISKTFWPPVAMLLTLMVELGVVFAPGRTAFENRYYYTGVLLLLLVLIEFFKGVKRTPLTVAVALALTFAAAFGNLPQFREGRQTLDLYKRYARAEMAVVQLAGRHGNQYFDPNVDAPAFTPRGLWTVTGVWREVVDRYGSAAYSVPELRQEAESVREKADVVAVKALELRIAKAHGAEVDQQCRRIGAPNRAPTKIDLPKGGAVVKPSGDSEVSLRRWANQFAAGLRPVRAGETAVLRIPADPAANVPWQLSFAQGGSVTVCAIS